MEEYTDSPITKWLCSKLTSAQAGMRNCKIHKDDFEKRLYDISLARNEVFERVAGYQLQGKIHLMEKIREAGSSGAHYAEQAFDAVKYPSIFAQAVESILKELEERSF
jgi:hypothetical protein